jgi:hypothetical protein
VYCRGGIDSQASKISGLNHRRDQEPAGGVPENFTVALIKHIDRKSSA